MKPDRTIAAVVFDAVGTLIEPHPLAADVYVTVGRKYGSRLSATEVATRFRAAFRQQEAVDSECHGLRTSEARERERWQGIVATVLDDVAAPTDCFEELYQHFATPQAWRCFPEVAVTLETLGRRGYRLGVASNYDRRLRSVLAGLTELSPIRDVVISSEVGWRKPAGQFFASLCQRLELPAEAVLLVGDDLANDYLGARDAGLRAVLLDPLRRVSDAERITHLGELPEWLAQA